LFVILIFICQSFLDSRFRWNDKVKKQKSTSLFTEISTTRGKL